MLVLVLSNHCQLMHLLAHILYAFVFNKCMLYLLLNNLLLSIIFSSKNPYTLEYLSWCLTWSSWSPILVVDSVLNDLQEQVLISLSRQLIQARTETWWIYQSMTSIFTNILKFYSSVSMVESLILIEQLVKDEFMLFEVNSDTKRLHW